MDFDEWIKLPGNQPIEYYVTFKDDGSLIGVYPTHVVGDIENKISIDQEIATAINTGFENLFSYTVDIPTKKLLKLNKFSTHNLIKVDDVLHRIVNKKWATMVDPDIVVTHVKADDKLIFSMSTRYSKNTVWDGETAMQFLITQYNDPNALLGMISIRVGDITHAVKSFEIALPDKFSVYTRRIFEKYIFETV